MPRITSDHLEPLAVSPRQACTLLKIGVTRLYQLLRNNELESYLDGRARRITMDSIHRRITRLLAGASPIGPATENTPQPRRPGRTAEHDRWSEHGKSVGGLQEDVAE